MVDHVPFFDFRVFSYDPGGPFSVREVIMNGFSISAHELRQFGLFALHRMASRGENGCGKGNLHSGDIQDDFEAQPLGKKIMWRAGGEGVDRSRLESRDSLTDTTELNVLEIFERIHLETRKRGLREDVRRSEEH